MGEVAGWSREEIDASRRAVVRDAHARRLNATQESARLEGVCDDARRLVLLDRAGVKGLRDIVRYESAVEMFYASEARVIANANIVRDNSR